MSKDVFDSKHSQMNNWTFSLFASKQLPPLAKYYPIQEGTRKSTHWRHKRNIKSQLFVQCSPKIFLSWKNLLNTISNVGLFAGPWQLKNYPGTSNHKNRLHAIFIHRNKVFEWNDWTIAIICLHLIPFVRCVILLSFQDICPHDWWRNRKKRKRKQKLSIRRTISIRAGQYQLKITLRFADIAVMFIVPHRRGDCCAQSMNGHTWQSNVVRFVLTTTWKTAHHRIN